MIQCIIIDKNSNIKYSNIKDINDLLLNYGVEMKEKKT